MAPDRNWPQQKRHKELGSLKVSPKWPQLKLPISFPFLYGAVVTSLLQNQIW